MTMRAHLLPRLWGSCGGEIVVREHGGDKDADYAALLAEFFQVIHARCALYQAPPVRILQCFARELLQGVTGSVAGATPGAVYEQYADATGHAPPLRENAMIFWQSRNRYMSSDIALGVAQHYEVAPHLPGP